MVLLKKINNNNKEERSVQIIVMLAIACLLGQWIFTEIQWTSTVCHSRNRKKKIRIIIENLQLLAYQIWQRARSASWPAPEQCTGRPDLWNPLCLQRGCLGKKRKKKIWKCHKICCWHLYKFWGRSLGMGKHVRVSQPYSNKEMSTPNATLWYSLYHTWSPEGHSLILSRD